MSLIQRRLPEMPTGCAHMGCAEPLAGLLLVEGCPMGFCEAHMREHQRYERATKSWREALADGRAKWWIPA